MSNNSSASARHVRISYNSKAVLLGLFSLVGFILIVFSILLSSRPDLIDRLITVFVAAISGSLTLGGTLISQLWGRRSNSRGTNEPKIYLTDPYDGQEDVSLETSITATFDKLIDESTVDSNTFVLTYDASKVDGMVTLFATNKVVFKPRTKLKPSTKYTATVVRGVKDVSGNSISNDKVWSFVTASEHI
jgi:hypothetical protein